MTIWILAFVLLAAGGSLGLKQGGIRAAFSFTGILAALLLAGLAGKLFKPLLPHVGIENPTLIWLIAPLEGFVILLIVFKAAGFAVHRKVAVYYKYKAGDLQLALWERLNSRLGLCIGLMNGAAYLVLISFVIYNFSYWTVQIAPSDGETKTTRLINRMGRDLESTGLSKAARSVGSMPDMYYKLADLAGLLAQNPGLSDRLARYPAFISLAERPDLQQLAQDESFTGAWKQGAPAGQLLNDSQVKAILKNQDLINSVYGILRTNTDDLVVYLKTGKSPKYDSEQILGRWDLNVGASAGMLLQAQPNISPKEMKAIRALWNQAFAKTSFIAGADGQVFLKDLPNFELHPPGPETWKGQWSNNGTNYDLSLKNGGETKSATAQTDGLRLTLKMDTTLVFDRAD